MDLFSLVARLTLDRSDYEKGVVDAQKEAQSLGSKLKSGLGTAAKVGGVALAAAGTAATAMTKAIVDGAGAAASYGDNIDKMSQKLGISAEAYQEWDAVLQHSGTSIDSMGIGMKTLANKAAEGSDAFKKLGISQEKAAKMSREDLFAETITALQNVTNENERAQLAQELFGRSAMELGPLLNTSAKDTAEMRKRVHELGGVMSNEAVKSAAAYQDSLQDMQTAIDGTKRNLVSEFLPSLTTVMDGITEVFTTGGTEKISRGIRQFVSKLNDIIPKVLDIGGKIIMALTSALVSNLPNLIESAGRVILTLGEGLLKELPQIVKAGLHVILALARGIADSLPELIPTIVDVVLEIVDILTEPNTLAQLVDAAIQIMLALIEGIVNATPQLIEKFPGIVANIVQAIIQSLPKILEAGGKLIAEFARGIVENIGKIGEAIGSIGEKIMDGIGSLVDSAAQWGRDMIDNFIGGIKGMWDKAKNAVSDFAGGIKRFLGFSEPEEGPLSDFHTYAPDMVKLFAQGIKDNQGLLDDAINGAFNFRPTIAAGMTGGQEYTVPRAGTAASAPRNIIIPLYIDGREFARAEVPYIEAEQRRYGVRIATGGVY